MALQHHSAMLARPSDDARMARVRSNVVERVNFTVGPLYNGWQVRDALRNRDWCAQLEDAVIAADTLAQALHALTGKPTGTVIDDGNGQQIQCGLHG